MQSLDEQVCSYAAYHQDTRNKATHFVGVPLVSFALLVALGWLRFAEGPVPLTGATLFWGVVFVYYLVLDWRIALFQAPITLLLLFLADMVSQWPWPETLAVFGAAMVGGWIIQLAGHAIEGKRPALADNFFQIFNAPLFLTVEVLLALGYRPELRAALSRTRAAGPVLASVAPQEPTVASPPP
jgi:uncharacterized membrane protein YGL010W